MIKINLFQHCEIVSKKKPSTKEMKDLGTEVYIAVRNKQLKAKVVSLPFYKK